MSVALSGPFLSMLSANSTAFFSVVSNWSLQTGFGLSTCKACRHLNRDLLAASKAITACTAEECSNAGGLVIIRHGKGLSHCHCSMHARDVMVGYACSINRCSSHNTLPHTSWCLTFRKERQHMGDANATRRRQPQSISVQSSMKPPALFRTVWHLHSSVIDGSRTASRQPCLPQISSGIRHQAACPEPLRCLY